jgi:hypothetical protein
MLNIENFTPAQREIIQIICGHKLDSLNRLLRGEPDCDIDIELYLYENEVSEEEFINSLNEQITNFKKLHRNPDDLRVLPKEEMSGFKHVLANLEKDYSEKYPLAIANLWNRVNIMDNLRINPISFLN